MQRLTKRFTTAEHIEWGYKKQLNTASGLSECTNILFYIDEITKQRMINQHL